MFCYGRAGRCTAEGPGVKLHVEVAEDETFDRVVATALAPVSAASDWTCRVLVGGLKPGRVYWYRFTDSDRLRQPSRQDDHGTGG